MYMCVRGIDFQIKSLPKIQCSVYISIALNCTLYLTSGRQIEPGITIRQICHTTMDSSYLTSRLRQH